MSRVLAFLVRRFLAAVFIVLLMIVLTFVIYWAIPSQPASFVYPTAPHLTTYQIDTAHHLLRLDRPKITQVVDYVWHVMRGDFGKQWAGTEVTGKQTLVQQAISPTLFAKTRVTGSILIGGAFLVLVLALPLGALAARFQNSIGDRALSLVTLIAICLHPMVLGLILRTWFGDQLHWLPDSGYCTFIQHKGATPTSADFFSFSQQACGGPWPWAQHLILPWISFALLFLALYARMTRASVLEVLHEDFVRTARAKGASETRVIGRHVLPNVGIRILTMIGMEIGTAIGVCVYIESAFGMEGLGRYAVDTFAGTRGLDLPVVLAVVTMITVFVIVGNLIVDILYALLDPRVGGTTTRARRTPGAEPLVV